MLESIAMEPTRPTGAGRLLPVLALTSLYPDSRRPGFALFSRRRLEAIAARSDLGLVAPIPCTLLARRGGQAPPPPGRLMERPVFWYVPGAMRGLQGRAFLTSAMPALTRMRDALGARVIFACWAYPDGWAGVRAGRRLGLPVVLQVMGSDLYQQAEDPARRPLIKEALAGADAVVAVSAPLARRALALGARRGRVFVVHNGVDTARFFPADRAQARAELGIPQDRRLLLFVGNLAPVKDPAMALKALSRVAGADLVLVGDGPLRPELRRMCGELGLSQRVCFAGARDNAAVARYLAAADALLLSSRSEGEPNVVLEALASGRPVAAFAVGGVPDLVREGENGALARPGDGDALGAAAGRVLDGAWDPRALAAGWGRTWGDAAGEYLTVLRAAALGALWGTKRPAASG